MSEFVVKIEYKNKNLETVVEKEYDLISYTEMLNLELMRLIMEVEDAFYVFSGNKQKEDWPPELTERFKKIRHKMLDTANSIKRLPQNLSFRGIRADQVTMGEYLNRTMK
jgi:hypothetical protein